MNTKSSGNPGDDNAARENTNNTAPDETTASVFQSAAFENAVRSDPPVCKGMKTSVPLAAWEPDRSTVTRYQILIPHMSIPLTINFSRPRIMHPRDLLYYTGIPQLPPEKTDKLTAEQRRKGGRPARKTISGVREMPPPKKGTKIPKAQWRALVRGSGAHAKDIHKEFNTLCYSREEAAFIASMAHRVLKPAFARACRTGADGGEPAGPGHRRFFWNNIWGLWKFCRLTTSAGEFIVGAIVGAREDERRVFITDFREDIYARIIRAPLFSRRMVHKQVTLEPVQPEVVRNDKGGANVIWTGLSELVLGRKAEITPGVLNGWDYREAALLMENPRPVYPELEEGWYPPIEPERFNAVVPATPEWAVHHPYGVVADCPGVRQTPFSLPDLSMAVTM